MIIQTCLSPKNRDDAKYPSNTVMIVLNDNSEKVDLKASKISEKVKTIMFWSISHELRSPLNHITGIHSILKSKLDTKEQKGLMRIAESSTEILKMKIDDILDFYEVETGDFLIQKVMFDVRNQCIRSWNWRFLDPKGHVWCPKSMQRTGNCLPSSYERKAY